MRWFYLPTTLWNLEAKTKAIFHFQRARKTESKSHPNTNKLSKKWWQWGRFLIFILMEDAINYYNKDTSPTKMSHALINIWNHLCCFPKQEKHFVKNKKFVKQFPHLSSDYEKPTRQKRDLSLIKGFDYGDYTNSISRATSKSTSGVSKDGNEDMFLHVKRTRVERKWSWPEPWNLEPGGG